MGDTKKQRLLAELVRIRNVNQAQNLAKKCRQGKAPDNVLHSARIIGIDPKKSALWNGNSNKGTQENNSSIS